MLALDPACMLCEIRENISKEAADTSLAVDLDSLRFEYALRSKNILSCRNKSTGSPCRSASRKIPTTPKGRRSSHLYTIRAGRR